MRVAIYSRTFELKHLNEIQELLNNLNQLDIEYTIYQPLVDAMRDTILLPSDISVYTGFHDLDRDVSFMISLGGDGTMLDSVTIIRDRPIGLIGINFGRLGFLSTIGKDDFKTAILSMLNGNLIQEKRTLVHLNASIPMFDEVPFGINEFAIHKRDSTTILKIDTYMNGTLLNNYWCDGLIVATPTGCTGYSLSCGGPIIFPDSETFVITPIAPHQLNVRPIIVKDDCTISFKVDGRLDDFICALDARKQIVPKDTIISVSKEKFSINLVRLPENNFLHTLQSKLMWGVDKRN